MSGVVTIGDAGSDKGQSAEVTRRRGGSGPVVLSVIGPVEDHVQEVASGLRTRLPRHRILVGAGPDVADGVIAVASPRRQDVEILLAIRNAMGGCIFYTDHGVDEAEPGVDVRQEPGITVVQWQAGHSSIMDLDRLAHIVELQWIDIPRWVSDARMADADRIDRVRVAVRLAAEKCAAELMSPDAATLSGRVALSALFRARVRCLVLEHGVEWPHLAEGPTVSAILAAPETTEPSMDISTAVRHQENRMRFVLILAMSCGAGVAVTVAISQLIGPLGGVASGMVVGGAMAVIRWRMFAAARRAQKAERGIALLRRQWSADVTEVVTRLRIPQVAEAIVQEVRA